jgi:glycerol kinase
MPVSKRYILSVDQSTSGTKVQLINQEGKKEAILSKNHKQYYPRPGWVEHDPMEIYGNVRELLQRMINQQGLERRDISAVAITNQRETIVAWDRSTGLPVYNAIAWQCRRTAEDCERLKAEGLEEIIRFKTGLMVDPYFSATKMKWILEHAEGAKERAADGRLLFGTIDSWLVWKLTGGRVHATDYTNASRTMLLNLHNLSWDPDLLRLFGVPAGSLPEVRYSDEHFGTMELDGMELPIIGVVGDSHGALIGQMCFEPGMVKATYGTGSSLMMNAGREAIEPSRGLTSTIGYAFGGQVHYAIEGIVHSTGDTLKWMKDQLGLFADFTEAEELASSLPDNEGVYLVPAFSGMGAPYWNAYMRASITGLTRGSDKRHVIRAGMESIAYQIKDVLDLMEEATGIPIRELRADGGPTKNRFLMQFQADIARLQVVCTDVSELSGMGAAYVSGIGVGWWTVEKILKLERSRYVYAPLMAAGLSSRYYREWQDVVAESHEYTKRKTASAEGSTQKHAR